MSYDLLNTGARGSVICKRCWTRKCKEIVLFFMNRKSLHPLLLSIDLTSEYHEGNTIEKRYLILGRRNVGNWIVKKDSGKGYECR